jgi:hypothetical protein
MIISRPMASELVVVASSAVGAANRIAASLFERRTVGTAPAGAVSHFLDMGNRTEADAKP